VTIYKEYCKTSILFSFPMNFSILAVAQHFSLFLFSNLINKLIFQKQNAHQTPLCQLCCSFILFMRLLCAFEKSELLLCSLLPSYFNILFHLFKKSQTEIQAEILPLHIVKFASITHVKTPSNFSKCGVERSEQRKQVSYAAAANVRTGWVDSRRFAKRPSHSLGINFEQSA
jgi:hypothetical protein